MYRSRRGNHNAAAAFRAIAKRPGRIVFIAPHPDDETLGTGRLILMLKRIGVVPAFIVLTDGGASHLHSSKWPASRLGHLRKQELRRALGRLGLGQPRIMHMGWRDAHVTYDGCSLRIRAILHALNAKTVFVTSPLDHHSDHKAAFNLVSAAVDRRVMKLWTYAVWSRTETHSARSFERGQAQQKWAMKAHRSQTSMYIDDDPLGFTFTAAQLSQIIDADEHYVPA